MPHVVFLRAVNVGGYNTFRPSLLAKQLRGCDVVNVGAAGTFVIRNRINRASLRAELIRRLPFEAEIMICSGREILDAVAADPFDGQPSGPGIVRFVSVLARRSHVLPVLPLTLPSEEWLVKLIAIRDRFAFGLYRKQMRTMSYLGRIEKQLGVPATTRNWNTISSIAKLLQES
jgi:uncharacterized protein (DUF1697 family)